MVGSVAELLSVQVVSEILIALTIVAFLDPDFALLLATINIQAEICVVDGNVTKIAKHKTLVVLGVGFVDRA
jgi:hypothetical protein